MGLLGVSSPRGQNSRFVDSLFVQDVVADIADGSLRHYEVRTCASRPPSGLSNGAGDSEHDSKHIPLPVCLANIFRFVAKRLFLSTQ